MLAEERKALLIAPGPGIGIMPQSLHGGRVAAKVGLLHYPTGAVSSQFDQRPDAGNSKKTKAEKPTTVTTLKPKKQDGATNGYYDAASTSVSFPQLVCVYPVHCPTSRRCVILIHSC